MLSNGRFVRMSSMCFRNSYRTWKNMSARSVRNTLLLSRTLNELKMYEIIRIFISLNVFLFFLFNFLFQQFKSDIFRVAVCSLTIFFHLFSVYFRNRNRGTNCKFFSRFFFLKFNLLLCELRFLFDN